MQKEYIPRKKEPIAQSTLESIEFIALDWYECDLISDNQIEKKQSYLNQEHNKSYTIFIFGVSTQGHSICLRVKNYLPYFFVQIPDEFTLNQTEDFLKAFNMAGCDDYDTDDIEIYNDAITKKDFKATEIIKFNSRYYKSANVSNKSSIEEKKVFWTFMNEQKFQFAKLAFKSKLGYQFIERFLKSAVKLPIEDIKNPIKYNLFESDLEPVLRFMHDKKIKPSSWIHIDPGKFKIESRQSKCQINISCDWNDVQPLDRAEIPPLLIASFDIEADSSHGDFPIAKKDCKKLANQLVITWIRDQRTIEKRHYEIAYSALLKSIAKSKQQLQHLVLEPVQYIDKKDPIHDSAILQQIQPMLTELIAAQETSTSTITLSATATINNANIDANIDANIESIVASQSKLLIYYREVIKYIIAKQNIAQTTKFFDMRIKKALQYPQFTNVDDEVDFIYLKRAVQAKMFINNPASDYLAMVQRIYNICNNPIKKIKANTLMKKAQKEVAFSEEAKIKNNPRFNMEDLISLINTTARKYNIQERDLQAKIITKETMVRFVSHELNRAFGFAKGDTVIQIGTVFWRYGEPTIAHNNIITLKSCTPFKVGNQWCEVISRTEERDVLIEWAKLIDEHDPDIIIGYNTFGFDESFMYDRITDLCHNTDRITLSREDMKMLEANLNYQKFINLGRFDNDIIKRVPEAKGGIINKKLSSSALGDNFLYYFNMPGRVQIDLLKVCQASLTKLPSYKLDSVAEFYISGKIKDIILEHPDDLHSTRIKVDNIYELEEGNFIVISMAATTAKLNDGEKFKILKVDRESGKITLDSPVPRAALSSVPMWGLGKDDVSPQDIFRLQKGSAVDRATIAKYCIQDCALLIRLLRKLEVISNNFGMSNVCLVPFSYIFLRGQGIKAFSLITNECAKEDFLLPVLERIEPEELVVDDSIRQTHTQVAVQRERADEDGDVDCDDNTTMENVENEVDSDNEDSDEEMDDDSRDISDTRSKSKSSLEISKSENNSEITEPEIHPSQKRFQLPKDFNRILMTDESYEGAIVLKPVTDIYTEDPITVLDFSSLYPSEMITSDLSHDRICEDPYWLGETGARHLEQLGLSYLDRSYDNFEWIDPKKKSKGKRKCGTTTVRFVQYPDGRKGLIPRILMGLLASRKATKKRMEAEPDPFKKALYDGLQLAYKVTANSVYGQIGARTSKMYKPQIAASTTAGGRMMIQKAKAFFIERFNAKIAYGDTDSLFLKFPTKCPSNLQLEKNANIPDLEKINHAIKMGQEAERELKKILPGVHCMAYEKVLFPFILISKKRYFALKYEDDPTKYKQISMGLILKRRDNAPILKHCYLGVLDSLVKDKNIPKAIEYVQNECRKMVDGAFDMNMFVISKTLSAYYADPEAIAHKVLADRMGERDPGNKPQSNERIPYVFIKIKEEPGVEYLQGDRIEHVEYVRKNKLKVDYEKYILNQIMKPVSQLFELVVERLPNFPYGRGYYEEMYNIWYNKYSEKYKDEPHNIEPKTEKKIKELKAKMVQKLVFQPLIEYARMKISNTKTIDEWFKPQAEEQEQNQIIKVKKQDTHEIKIKKSKQLSLDKFFN
jgi:DNA polymerase elongation subunit (family B)